MGRMGAIRTVRVATITVMFRLQFMLPLLVPSLFLQDLFLLQHTLSPKSQPRALIPKHENSSPKH